MAEPSDANWDDMVLVGIIARAHGLRGQVVVNPETDFVEERFAPGARVWARIGGDPTRLTVGSMRVQGGRPVIGFEGIETIEAAEALAGTELRIPESELQPLAEGTFYHHQLIGCEVVTDTGNVIGSVTKVDDGAGSTLLVVQGQDGEVLIPLVQDICTAIVPAERRIVVTLPPGLLELNERTRPSRA
jgi:16S rRNA processing protein RimM